MKIKRWVSALLIGAIVGIGIYLYSGKTLHLHNSNPNQYSAITKSSNALEILGFIPYWAVPKNAPPIDYIALFALEPTDDGWHNQFQTMPRIPEGTKVLWTLKIHGGDHTTWMDTPEGIADMIEKLAVYMNQADGIVINLEDWTKYLRLDDIAIAFHRRYPGKLIMITLPSWGLPTTANIYHLADRFILMAYDYDFKSGVLAPISKVESSIRFYESLSDKLLLGIPLYGYLKTDKGTQAVQIKNIEDATVSYSKEGEAKTRGETGTITWNDIKTISEKIALARKYHLRGIALWAVGYTSDEFIEKIIKEAYTATK
ncbi:hypothetical protein GM182_01145 [bacterium 3DAC]|nr:hypothetical protein [Dictyoglomota bacterium]UZN22549.1 hypothetical protein GM182_01145 [bacterium 3DAC]